ncbi:MAG: hypothetical protein OEM23_00215 [Gemmatimonadota bacterium]|nr:hypothetical protein [Gemmatimonadota bacterium]MDH3426830.1 hypothetical protein [Gemmatimonadota bacterium]
MSEIPLHPLLERQLEKVFPDHRPANLEPLIALVDQAYRGQDDDRALLERSLDASSTRLLWSDEALKSVLSVTCDAAVRVDANGSIISVLGGQDTCLLDDATSLVGCQLNEGPVACSHRELETALRHAGIEGSDDSIVFTRSLDGQAHRFRLALVATSSNTFAAVIRRVPAQEAANEFVSVRRRAMHDLANQVGSILGLISLAAMDLEETHPAHEAVADALGAVNAATELLRSIRTSQPAVQERPATSQAPTNA